MWWRRKKGGSEPAKERIKSGDEATTGATDDGEVMDRAAFLRAGAGHLRSLGMTLGHELTKPLANRIAPPLVPPPGALNIERFFDACTRCGDCVDACHQDVILIADARHGVNAGLPYLDVENHKPCYLCTRPVCADACESGALSPITQAQIRLGTARLLTDRCLAWNDTPCTACLDACFLPIPAVLVADDGRVVIDPELCTGCGMCFHACPTSPKAIEVR